MYTNEKSKNNCQCNSNEYYKPAYYSNKSEDHCNDGCHEEEHEEVDCCKPIHKPSKPEKKHEPCTCCKHDLQSAMKLLFKTPFSSYIDPSAFTLFTAAFSTTSAATSIKNISSCNGDGITYNDGSVYTYTTFCDLTGFSVKLLTPAVNVPLFLHAIKAVIPHYDADKQCCANDSCCCNSSKASFLSGSLSTVNIKADGLGFLPKLTVAGVTDNLAVLVDAAAAAGVVYFVCLNSLRFIG